METFEHCLRLLRDTAASVAFGIVQIVILLAIIRRVIKFDAARRKQSIDRERAEMRAAARRAERE